MSPAHTSTARQFPWAEQTTPLLPQAHSETHPDHIILPLHPRARQDVNRLLHWYVPADMLALLIGFLCAWGMANVINGVFFYRPVMNPLSDGSVRLLEFLMVAGGVIGWLQHTDHYRMRIPFWLEIKKIVSTLGFAMMADGFLQFAVKQDFSRLWLISGWVIAALAMVSFRNLLRNRWRQQGRFQIRTLLVGTGETAQHTRTALESAPCLGYEVAAQIKELPQVFLHAGKSWEKLCAIYGVDYVVIALDGPELATATVPLAQLARESVPFSISPPLGHLPVMGMVPHYFFNHDVMLLARNSGLEQPLPCFLKRFFDVLIATAALLVLSPVMIVIALMVRRDGGRAMFGHSRLGRSGKTFSCLKFRSMVMNGDEVLERHFLNHPEARLEWQATRKLQNDPRVTQLGNFLRRSSLDEMPQLLNVLKGDMSLVGPRPIVTAEVANYDGDIAHYYRVRPGITGLWQVSGRNDVSYPQRVHMDSWYVRNWSLWHDIAILCKTFPALLQRKGAY